MQPAMHPDPSKLWEPGDDLDLGAGFVQQRGRLQSALTGSDHNHPLPRQLGNLPPLIAMGSLFPREVREHGRLGSEWPYPRGHYDAAAAHRRAVLQSETEMRIFAAYTADPAAVQACPQVLLKPASVL